MILEKEAEIEWRGAVPVSTRYGDPYYSLENGLAESRHVFLAANGLPERFRPGFHIAELGFGTGLNLLASLELWLSSGQPGALRYTSFEAYPIEANQMERAIAQFPSIANLARPIIDGWSAGLRCFRERHFSAEVVIGDARRTLPAWPGAADAWFLDGFAPASNPELWEAPLLAEVAAHTAPGGTFATYTAAGAVRRSLERAGFDVTRQPGFGRKRHMTSGRLLS